MFLLASSSGHWRLTISFTMSANIYDFVYSVIRAGIYEMSYVFLKPLPLRQLVISFTIRIVSPINQSEVLLGLSLDQCHDLW